MIPLAVYAHRIHADYARVLRLAIRGDIGGAERLGGRWYVPDSAVPEVAAAARRVIPPEVDALHRVAAALEVRPLHPHAFDLRGT